MSSTAEICSSFVESSPAGELTEVVNDIKALTSDDDPALIDKLKPAFQKYNEEHLIAVKLPSGSQHVSILHMPTNQFRPRSEELTSYCANPGPDLPP